MTIDTYMYTYPFSVLRLNLVLTPGIHLAFRGGTLLFIPPTAIGSRNCVPMALTAEGPLEQGQ